MVGKTNLCNKMQTIRKTCLRVSRLEPHRSFQELNPALVTTRCLRLVRTDSRVLRSTLMCSDLTFSFGFRLDYFLQRILQICFFIFSKKRYGPPPVTVIGDDIELFTRVFLRWTMTIAVQRRQRLTSLGFLAIYVLLSV